jgi:glycosyltransferase involved in cell wall biosynthesis
MFDNAVELLRRGWRVSLVTAVPKRMIGQPLDANAQVLLGLATALGGVGRLRRRGITIPFRWRSGAERLARIQFARFGRRFLDGAQVVDGMSGWSLECGIEAQRQGIPYVCNRGSAHIVWQKNILEEEFGKWGAPIPTGFPRWNLERELAEYEIADAIAVPSRFSKRTFVAHGVPESKVCICPYGVDLSMYSPSPRSDDHFRVLFVGSASVQKGIGYLFDAVRPLAQRGQAELWLVGAISEEASALCARNRDIFTFKGFVPRERLSQVYSQGSVLVLPSLQEGLALVMAQAMACGVPVIATPNTGAEDLFENGEEGFIVPERDARAIQDRIEWMIENPGQRELMAAKALMRVQTLGGWRRYGDSVEHLYRGLMEGKPALLGAG